MSKSHPRLATLGAFVAGGVLIGGLTVAAGVAHGAGLHTQEGNALNSHYSGAHAWAQAIPIAASGPETTSLSIPPGARVEITSAVDGVNGPSGESMLPCTMQASVNGADVSYAIDFRVDGDNFPIQPMYADSGSITCPGGGTSADAGTLVGYLTPAE
jgi:hypothetical protein